MESPTSWLQKWKKNEIFENIQAVGLDPKDFDLEVGDVEVRINLKWSGSCFIIGGGPSQYVGCYVIGDSPAWPFEVYSWQAVIERISRWLKEAKRDLETPDLWAELRQDAELFRSISSDGSDNSPFSPDEQKAIATQLRELVEHATRRHSLTETQVQILEAKINYLVKAVGRIGKSIGATPSLGRSLVSSSPRRECSITSAPCSFWEGALEVQPALSPALPPTCQ